MQRHVRFGGDSVPLGHFGASGRSDGAQGLRRLLERVDYRSRPADRYRGLLNTSNLVRFDAEAA